ncbi:hypothetical protein KVT40_009294 [Elsinoe batatas]|uniref:Uncharacterized protein n=1 Tax=Elsinoe batatas TaxID=2601811 RepID=A0A8K0PD79_9PEZI|nr:hypothetical protein KVT40_009294 [Elsinoe batatas]
MPPKRKDNAKKTGLHGFKTVAGKTATGPVRKTRVNKTRKTGGNTLGSMPADSFDRKTAKTKAAQKPLSGGGEDTYVSEETTLKQKFFDSDLDTSWTNWEYSNDEYEDSSQKDTDEEYEGGVITDEHYDIEEHIADEGDIISKKGQETDYGELEKKLKAPAYCLNRLNGFKKFTKMVERMESTKDDKVPDTVKWDKGGRYHLIEDPKGKIECLGGGLWRDLTDKTVMKRTGKTFRQEIDGKMVTSFAAKVVTGTKLKQAWSKRQEAETKAKNRKAMVEKVKQLRKDNKRLDEELAAIAAKVEVNKAEAVRA